MKIKLFCLSILLSTSLFGAKASWYAEPFHGRTTASGYIYNKKQLTCASNKHKFGTVLKVTNKANDKYVVVVVTDTGSFDRKYGRDIDLSQDAFGRLDKIGKGLLDVNIEVISTANTFRYKHGNPKFDYNKYTKGVI